MKLEEEIKHFEKTIKILEKGYGTQTCKDYHPDCKNCQAQTMIGLVREHLNTLEWEKDYQATRKGLASDVNY